MNKKSLSIVLTILVLINISLFMYLNFFVYSTYENKFQEQKNVISSLKEEEKEIILNTNLDTYIKEYDENANKIKILKDSREKVFISWISLNWEEKFDFFPDVLNEVLPKISKHIHKNVVVEGVSLNEKSEIIIAVRAPNYSILSKQYASFKTVFEEELSTFITDINVWTFIMQEVELFETDEFWTNNKVRKNVAKTTITAKINPKSIESSLVKQDAEEFDFSWLLNKDKEGFFSTSIKIIKKDLNIEDDKVVVKIIESEVVEELEEVSIIEEIEKEEVKLLTIKVPVFTMYNMTWEEISTEMSKYLSAGKKITVGDKLYIDPTMSYTDELLKEISVKMMEYIMDNSKKEEVVFYKSDFDISSHEWDVLDLLELNDR